MIYPFQHSLCIVKEREVSLIFLKVCLNRGDDLLAMSLVMRIPYQSHCAALFFYIMFIYFNKAFIRRLF